MTVQHLKTVVWQSHDCTSLEYCSLFQGDSLSLEGTVIATLDEQSYSLSYSVLCDLAGRTVSVSVLLSSEGQENKLELEVDSEQRWWTDGKELTALRGCTDIDLGITPATNTLPIRRLNLAEGEGAHVSAAWLRFPGLELQPLAQRYTRLDQTTYLYESHSETNSGGYKSQLEVDEHSLVANYANGWARLT